MNTTENNFAEVILPLALPNLFTYRLRKEMKGRVLPGQRVIVPFGRGGKFYTAIIESLHDNPPKEYEAKYLEDILEEEPSVNSFQFDFWKWISDYYMCSIGEVMNAALPSGLKINSDTKVVLHSDYKSELSKLDQNEGKLVDILENRKELSLKEVSEALETKNFHPILKKLRQQNVIITLEEIKERYRPKLVTYVLLSEKMQDEEQLKLQFEKLNKAPRQLEVLMTYLQMKAETGNPYVDKVLLQKRSKSNSSTINQLVDKDVFELKELEIGRFDSYQGEVSASNVLNEDQKNALEAVKNYFEDKDIVLLHGVTSSGKTEVYIKLIEDALEKGEQVLYLLPEIALTTQLISRLQKHFGDLIGVYHSKFNEQERTEVWNCVKNGHDVSGEVKFQVILGARSSVFLPFNKLGLIIVDEEHENSFKQFDPAPRYNARDVATVLGKMHASKILLGSATPSIETYWNADNEKYGLVEMLKRHGGVSMPEILCADIADATKRKQMKGHFSPLLMEHMEEALKNREQIILFQNRRGYAPIMLCETCGNSPQCKNCDVSLTYHKYFNHFNCHYCNYTIPVPEICPSCGSNKVSLKGFGTEKIEEDLSIIFPTAKVQRMDHDSTRTKNAHGDIIRNFENRSIDILVGTQMITKGLDFDNVAVVGILNADNMLQFPDFRSYERSYQLMAQVSGRAGRKKKRGKVIIQTYNPEHRIIRNVIDNNYREMYRNELLERKNFQYPPYYRLIQFTILHRDKDKLESAALHFHKLLSRIFGSRVLGPQTPVISRIRNNYLKNSLLKIERSKALPSAKDKISEVIRKCEQSPEFKGVRIKIDVDPM